MFLRHKVNFVNMKIFDFSHVLKTVRGKYFHSAFVLDFMD